MMTKELTPRIIRNIVPNPRRLDLNMNIRISTSDFEDFYLPLRKSSERCLEKVGPIGAALVRRIDGILGCESVSLKQYSMQVTVGNAFDPDADGITGNVIEATRDCFGDKRDEVEVINKDIRHLYRESPRDPLNFNNGFSMPPLDGNEGALGEGETEHETGE